MTDFIALQIALAPLYAAILLMGRMAVPVFPELPSPPPSAAEAQRQATAVCEAMRRPEVA